MLEISQGVWTNENKFDGETTAVRLGAEALGNYSFPINVLSSSSTSSCHNCNIQTRSNVFCCREAFSHLQRNNQSVNLQWIQSHIDIGGNEKQTNLLIWEGNCTNRALTLALPLPKQSTLGRFCMISTNAMKGMC